MPFHIPSTADLSITGFSVYWAKLRQKRQYPALYDYLKPLDTKIEAEQVLFDALKNHFAKSIQSTPALAEIFSLPDDKVNQAISELMKVTQYDEHMSAREFMISQQFSAFLAQYPHAQLCILGGGLSLLPYYLANLFPLTLVLDTDKPSVIGVKKSWLETSGYYENTKNNYALLPVDLSSDKVLEKISQQDGFKLNSPTLFVLEGVTPYLTAKQTRDLLNQLTNALAGSQIFVGFSDNNAVGAGDEEKKILSNHNESYLTDIPQSDLMTYCEHDIGLTVRHRALHEDFFRARNGRDIPGSTVRRENYLLLEVSDELSSLENQTNSPLRLIEEVPLLPSLETMAAICSQKNTSSPRSPLLQKTVFAKMVDGQKSGADANADLKKSVLKI